MSGRTRRYQYSIQRNITKENNKFYSRHKVNEDRLSELPDELLVLIISQLTLREATLTSCLSSRWRYLWMHVTRLNFNVLKFIDDDVRFFPSLCRKEVSSNTSWINHVLGLHRAGFPLEEFSVSIPFHTSLNCEIDKWLKFASSKKVKSLKIDLSVNCREGIEYTFSPSVFGFEVLKVLALNWVNIDTQVVNFLLSKCPLLEQLSVQCSQLLNHVEIVGPSLKLKHLEICNCPIDSLEICNVINLVSFRYKGQKISNLLLENVTSLHNIDFEDNICESLYELVHCTQLVMLSIKASTYHLLDLRFTLSSFSDSFPKFSNLKVLWLKLTDVSTSFLLRVAPLLEVSPYLQKFTIELERWDTTRFSKNKGGSVYRKYVKHPHEHLQEVIHRGYIGDTYDLELTDYLFENTLALEKLIVDPRIQTSYVWKNSKVERRARGRARRQLEGKVPKGVKLIIL